MSPVILHNGGQVLDVTCK